ncbi:hypothetical protein SERLADRAFT_439889 [Serpula lacrymans var. lacrymans S7.9]|uniref:Uncharacterized protein n=1 Tax=Serpula lacrymans var. lacrymans (strain S7.9) TaxID=578457 RepID=F8P1X1_SERL9|nr:uncharacterized protein SERLADRAFT_439889 [Serpula lacrymans var. lacrymans S7.9]EGO23149.1 hypothetical protein SERLADRAFT_439889 [Serpula lacrymans var. lacrymans S7.9]
MGFVNTMPVPGPSDSSAASSSTSSGLIEGGPSNRADTFQTDTSTSRTAFVNYIVGSWTSGVSNNLEGTSKFLL